jgi:hypothetical protein
VSSYNNQQEVWIVIVAFHVSHSNHKPGWIDCPNQPPRGTNQLKGFGGSISVVEAWWKQKQAKA